jgi:mycofactocin precursor peptide peptidase
VTRLTASSWPEVARVAGGGATLLIPLGSTEQHGPHLPVTTDTDIAVAIAVGAAERDERLVVAPPMAYGSSGEHQAFAGTLSIGQDATELVLLELGRSASGVFSQVLVVSAHGGNSVPLARAMARLRVERRPVDAWSPSWHGDLHAGRTETSLMLAIAPDHVRLERAEAGDRRPLAILLPLLRHHGLQSVSANGVLGDPAGANADEGRRLLADAMRDLLAAAARLRRATTMEVTR